MVSVDYKRKFIVVHVAAGFARAVARVIEHWKLEGILGGAVTNNCIWIAPRVPHTPFGVSTCISGKCCSPITLTVQIR
ncbi:hypothetical protein [Erwinia tasmaniensis]|uniref:hypothetical protein n=1 Tax=Erwinia tasmaniensis TaxID=338565 RepID=UPI003A4E1A84